MTPRPLLLAAVFALAASGCAGGGAAIPASPAAEPERPRGFPGFDTSLYPGDSVMRAWRAPASPYVWVGYYLPAPCHRDTSWAGTRQRLQQMGWGTAVLYVGQQAWEGAPAPAPDSTGRADAAAARPIVCSRTLLGAEQGRQEAADAIAKAERDGFPRGTVIFLDIERMTAIPEAMRAYYRAWTAALLADGRYRPGAYLHGANRDAIARDLREVHAAAGAASDGDALPLWVAQPDAGFSPMMAPREGVPDGARVWQGRVDVTETWGGATLRIDANVADRASPSAP